LFSDKDFQIAEAVALCEGAFLREFPLKFGDFNALPKQNLPQP
jgi:hypothetical protein